MAIADDVNCIDGFIKIGVLDINLCIDQDQLFITDDGNMYRQQWQAESRMTDALRVHKQVRWCSIEEGKEPLTCEELDKMFDAQFAKSMSARNASPDSEKQKAEVPSMTLEEARAELARRRNSGQEGAKSGRKSASKV